jgi:hypothetical protein
LKQKHVHGHALQAVLLLEQHAVIAGKADMPAQLARFEAADCKAGLLCLKQLKYSTRNKQ